MTFSGTQVFTVADGINPPYRKRLADMDDFEALCVANAYRHHGNAAMANEIWTWRRRRIQKTPPPDAA